MRNSLGFSWGDFSWGNVRDTLFGRSAALPKPGDPNFVGPLPPSAAVVNLLDPTKPDPKTKAAVDPSTWNQKANDVINTIFGGLSQVLAVKYQADAARQAGRGQPVYVPKEVAQEHGLVQDLESYAPYILGVGAVVLVGYIVLNKKTPAKGKRK